MDTDQQPGPDTTVENWTLFVPEDEPESFEQQLQKARQLLTQCMNDPDPSKGRLIIGIASLVTSGPSRLLGFVEGLDQLFKSKTDPEVARAMNILTATVSALQAGPLKNDTNHQRDVLRARLLDLSGNALKRVMRESLVRDFPIRIELDGAPVMMPVMAMIGQLETFLEQNVFEAAGSQRKRQHVHPYGHVLDWVQSLQTMNPKAPTHIRKLRLWGFAGVRMGEMIKDGHGLVSLGVPLQAIETRGSRWIISKEQDDLKYKPFSHFLRTIPEEEALELESADENLEEQAESLMPMAQAPGALADEDLPFDDEDLSPGPSNNILALNTNDASGVSTTNLGTHTLDPGRYPLRSKSTGTSSTPPAFKSLNMDGGSGKQTSAQSLAPSGPARGIKRGRGEADDMPDNERETKRVRDEQAAATKRPSEDVDMLDVPGLLIGGNTAGPGPGTEDLAFADQEDDDVDMAMT